MKYPFNKFGLTSLIVRMALDLGKSVKCTVIVPHSNQLVCMYNVPTDRA